MPSPGDKFISLGDSFLQSAYVVLDLDQNQIGICQAILNATGTKIVEAPGSNGGSNGTAAIPSALPVTVTAAVSALPTQAAESGAMGTDMAADTATQISLAQLTPTFSLGGVPSETGSGPSPSKSADEASSYAGSFRGRWCFGPGVCIRWLSSLSVLNEEIESSSGVVEAL